MAPTESHDCDAPPHAAAATVNWQDVRARMSAHLMDQRVREALGVIRAAVSLHFASLDGMWSVSGAGWTTLSKATDDAGLLRAVTDLVAEKGVIQTCRRRALKREESQIAGALLKVIAEAERRLLPLAILLAVPVAPPNAGEGPEQSSADRIPVRELPPIPVIQDAAQRKRQTMIDRELGFFTDWNDPKHPMRYGTILAWARECAVSDQAVLKRLAHATCLLKNDGAYYPQSTVVKDCEDLLRAELLHAREDGAFSIMHSGSRSERYRLLEGWSDELGISVSTIRQWLYGRKGVTARLKNGKVVPGGFFSVSLIRAVCRGNIAEARLEHLR